MTANGWILPWFMFGAHNVYYVKLNLSDDAE